MQVYRIAKQKYIKDLSGAGAALYPGRWNSRNIPVLYTSESLALAAWELAVRIDSLNFPENLFFAVIEIPDDLIVTAKGTTKPDFFHSQLESIRIGDQFVQRAKKIALKVPSVVIPSSNNYVLNPQHPDFHSKVKLVKIKPFKYDERLQLW